jgi:hypothetical protein
MYRHIIQSVAAAASEAVIEEDLEAAEHAREIAGTFIHHRARATAYFILDAHNLTYMALGDEKKSVWERSMAAHERNPKVKPASHIGQREGHDFWTMLQKQNTTPTSSLEGKKLIKPSRSKFITGIRAVKSLREFGPIALETDPIAKQINYIGEIAVKTLSEYMPVFEITPIEILRAMQTALKARRYMDSAALLDSSVRNDPTYRYTSYLGHTLRGYDIRAELAVFDRDVRRKVKSNQ